MNTEVYLRSRVRDFNALTKEVAEAPKSAQGKDLGYCALHGSLVWVAGQVHTFSSQQEAYAFVLATFW